MTDITITNGALPATIDDLARFVLIGRDRMAAVRAEMRAINKLGLASDVHRQKLQEAQDIAEVVLRAEVKLGGMMAAIDGAPGARTDLEPRDTDVVRLPTKTDALAEIGFSMKQAQRLQQLANYPEIVEQAIAEAREKDDIASRLFVMSKIKAQEAQDKRDAIERNAEQRSGIPSDAIDIHATDKRYNIIYADPAWQYWEGGYKNQSLHYHTMTIDEICTLPVERIADANSVLFLWVTYPILPDSFRVIKAWGFEYSTAAFVWVKRNRNAETPFFGCGAWTRANTELCLLATRGHVTRLDASISQIVDAPVEEHSKKPDIVRTLITRLVGELPRIELFCRNPADGWDAWGDEL
jgi:N6-adenosine-specific RNA methylase IME4